MFILIGIFSLIVMVIVGCVRTKKRLKSQDEFAHNAVIKWALAGWSSFLIFIYLEASNNPDGNNTILLIVSICFIIATLISIIIDKICTGNNLRKEKIEEYKNSKNEW